MRSSSPLRNCVSIYVYCVCFIIKVFRVWIGRDLYKIRKDPLTRDRRFSYIFQSSNTIHLIKNASYSKYSKTDKKLINIHAELNSVAMHLRRCMLIIKTQKCINIKFISDLVRFTALTRCKQSQNGRVSCYT